MFVSKKKNEALKKSLLDSEIMRDFFRSKFLLCMENLQNLEKQLSKSVKLEKYENLLKNHEILMQQKMASDAENNRLNDLLQIQGAHINALSKKIDGLSVYFQGVIGRMDNTLTKKRKKMTDGQIKAYNLKQDGASIVKISSEMGISQSNVREKIRAAQKIINHNAAIRGEE